MTLKYVVKVIDRRRGISTTGCSLVAAATNEIKFRDFSFLRDCHDREYKQVFPERIFPLVRGTHRKSTTIQTCFYLSGGNERRVHAHDGRRGIVVGKMEENAKEGSAGGKEEHLSDDWQSFEFNFA